MIYLELLYTIDDEVEDDVIVLEQRELEVIDEDELVLTLETQPPEQPTQVVEEDEYEPPELQHLELEAPE